MARRHGVGIKETGWPGGVATGGTAVRRRHGVQPADGLRRRHSRRMGYGVGVECSLLEVRRVFLDVSIMVETRGRSLTT